MDRAIDEPLTSLGDELSDDLSIESLDQIVQLAARRQTLRDRDAGREREPLGECREIGSIPHLAVERSRPPVTPLVGEPPALQHEPVPERDVREQRPRRPGWIDHAGEVFVEERTALVLKARER
jgi:hypothetical protein